MPIPGNKEQKFHAITPVSEVGFDYIVAGAGCAGLSLLMHMLQSGHFSSKKILVIDRDLKKANDRTWCFWEKRDGLFEPIVYKKWNQLNFYGNNYSGRFSIKPYYYKMIRGIDFYNYCLRELGRHSNITLRFEEVDDIFFNGKRAGITVNGEKVFAQYVFNSILFSKPQLKAKDHWLLQHFKGWIIETEDDCFDEGRATLMDFRTDQREATSFCYVLPFSSRRALIEYTLFSEEPLDPVQYNHGLEFYINNVLKIARFKLLDEEFGVIPMTNHYFSPFQDNIINLGTAGGQTKGSSGYTFSNIQKHSRAIVEALITTGKPLTRQPPARFRFYDSVLLNILKNKKLPGEMIFSELFKKNDPVAVLKFLDNDTSLIQDLKIISTLPIRAFTMAAINQVF